MSAISWLALALGVAGSLAAVIGTCARCGGSGVVATKHGPVRCPFCSVGRMP